ncbi:MAG TPA: hypothetical protein V6C91_13325 [Coleofasciculaceae cyanobacterium]
MLVPFLPFQLATMPMLGKRQLAIMELLLTKLEGQHVYLFTDDSVEFYKKLGFKAQPTGLGKVVGQWLQN